MNKRQLLDDMNPSDLSDDDVMITLTEKGYDRIRIKKAWEEVRRAWDIIDELDEKIYLLERNNRTLTDIVSNLSKRSGIVVISPAYKSWRVKA